MGSELERKLDYADYAAMPADGKRHEILDGERVVTPAPSPAHQRISRRLGRQLDAWFRGDSGEMFHAPIDVILASGDIVQPDIVIVSDPAQVTSRGIEGAPLIVVEILSPSTREHDLGPKARRYLALGVRHYWVVDPESRKLECRRSEDGEFRRVAGAEADA